jgi:hypothetical protein
MLIEIIRQTSIRGQAVWVGDRMDVDESDARLLLSMGRARLVETLPAVEIIDQPIVQPAEVPAPEARNPRTRKPKSED